MCPRQTWSGQHRCWDDALELAPSRRRAGTPAGRALLVTSDLAPYSSTMLAEQLRDHDDEPSEDKIVVLRGLHWSDYQRMLELRGEAATPRFAYLQGQLEIMTPSRRHHSIKSLIGCLVEVWCLEKGVEFSTVGSWTLENKEAESGLEPDESYVFAPDARADRPDLAIEVVWTSGGLKKLDIYARLGVREVWFWRRGRITVHVLRGAEYVEQNGSELLAGIDLIELASFIERPTRRAKPSVSIAPRSSARSECRFGARPDLWRQRAAWARRPRPSGSSVSCCWIVTACSVRTATAARWRSPRRNESNCQRDASSFSGAPGSKRTP